MIWPFKKKVYQPFKAVVESMREKDAELYEKIRGLPIGEAIREWRKTHPEDFNRIPNP